MMNSEFVFSPLKQQAHKPEDANNDGENDAGGGSNAGDSTVCEASCE